MSSSASSSTVPANTNTNALFDAVELATASWTPLPCEKNDSHAEYLRLHIDVSELLKYISIENKTKADLVVLCLCCNMRIRKSITGVVKHFTLKKCPMTSVPDISKDAVIAKLVAEGERFTSTYGKPQTKGPPSQEIQLQPPLVFANDVSKRSYLAEQVSLLFLGGNLPPRLAENKSFVDFTVNISRIRDGVTFDDASSLKRDRVSSIMETLSKDLLAKSLERYHHEANIYGGTLAIDGWTDRKMVGASGLALLSYSVTHFVPALRTERSTGLEYANKIEHIIPWKYVDFCCTDGASCNAG